MTISSTALAALALLVCHFASDWWMQPRWMAHEKSTSLRVLLEHVAIVTLALLPVVLVFCPERWPLLGVNAVLHAFIDWNVWGSYKASIPEAERVTHPYWTQKRFYDTIAADQLMHLGLLALFFL